MILEGKAKKPVYIMIKDQSVEIKDASTFSGMLNKETAAAIRKEQSDDKIKVASIGPAGEKLVRFSAIYDDRRTASRGGVGAVMGSKNVKAIAVKGTHKVNVANKEKLVEITRKQADIVQNQPRLQGFRHLGTAAAAGFCHEIGVYPVKNFKKGVFKEINGKLTPEKVEELFVKDVHCHRCLIHCGSILHVKEGDYAGDPVEGPEYETFYSFGGELLNSDLGMVIEANRICDDYGVDTMTAGCCIGFAMECYENNILSKDDLDGIDLKWGDPKAIITLLKKIVNREGIGNILAEGTRMAAQKIGKGSEKYSIQVKGLELPGYEPRGLKGAGLNLATAALGASHCVGQCPQEIMGATGVDRFTVKGKGALCKLNQDKTAAYETGIVCIFPMQFNLIDMNALKEMINYATGFNDLKDDADMFKLGERIWNIERAFNIREGFSRKDDTFPERFLKEPMEDGPVKGQVFELEPMLDDYYQVRGWNRETGFPTREKLDSLDLSSVANELEKLNKLG
jgi:aldehyde:ferredoxin oxidoreductase